MVSLYQLIPASQSNSENLHVSVLLGKRAVRIILSEREGGSRQRLQRKSTRGIHSGNRRRARHVCNKRPNEAQISILLANRARLGAAAEGKKFGQLQQAGFRQSSRRKHCIGKGRVRKRKAKKPGSRLLANWCLPASPENRARQPDLATKGALLKCSTTGARYSSKDG